MRRRGKRRIYVWVESRLGWRNQARKKQLRFEVKKFFRWLRLMDVMFLLLRLLLVLLGVRREKVVLEVA